MYIKEWMLPLGWLEVSVAGERQLFQVPWKGKKSGCKYMTDFAHIWQEVSLDTMKNTPKGNEIVPFSYSSCHLCLPLTSGQHSALVRLRDAQRPQRPLRRQPSWLPSDVFWIWRWWEEDENFLWERGLASASCQNALSSFQRCVRTRGTPPLFIRVNLRSYSSIPNRKT